MPLEGVSHHGRTCAVVARLLDGEKMAPRWAEFGISRKTGYKLYDRHSELRVTADLYSHLQKQTAAKAAKVMDAVLGG
jgi:hypothetical protein